MQGASPLLALLTFVVAALYSSVGHGGASGYLAVMSLVGLAPAQMKPTALLLNILVAAVGSARYLHAKCFHLRTFLPLAIGSIPFAFWGGTVKLQDRAYGLLLGVVLVIAAASLLRPKLADAHDHNVPVPTGVAIGAGIGFLSGVVGIGGGIFLSPILILMRWATAKETLGVAAMFILVNSVAGLMGHLSSLHSLPGDVALLAAVAFFGGLIGSELGARRLNTVGVRRMLSLVLLIASAKQLFG
jgi:uncharacterized membrane protein YfcA